MSTPMPPPTKENLIKLIVQSRREMEMLIAPLSDEQLATIADPAGWTLKDHLAHLAVWEQGIAALLRGESRYKAMQMEKYPHLYGDFDALNEILHSRFQGLEAAKVRRISQQAHEAILAGLDPLNDEELMRPYNEFQEDKVAEGDSRPVFGLVAGNTIGHYREHLVIMKAAVEQAGI